MGMVLRPQWQPSNLAIRCLGYWSISFAQCVGVQMDSPTYGRVRVQIPGCASMRQRPARRMHLALRAPSIVHHLQASMASIAGSSQ
jgi:hypothetical protein